MVGSIIPLRTGCLFRRQPALLILGVTLFLGALPCLQAAPPSQRPFRYNTPQRVRIARLRVMGEQVPPLFDVLRECGMSDAEILAWNKARGPVEVIVEGWEAQAESDAAEAEALLASLPVKARARFLRLTYQWVGPIALWRDEVARQLGLTPDQRRKVQRLCIDGAERLAPANRSDGCGSVSEDPEGNAAYNRFTEQICRSRDTALLGVLTPEQRKAWRRLLGKPSGALQQIREDWRERGTTFTYTPQR